MLRERILQLRERYAEYRLDGADRDVFEMLYAIEHLQAEVGVLRASIRSGQQRAGVGPTDEQIAAAVAKTVAEWNR